MPKIFSEKERQDIISSLRNAAMAELAAKGVRKTTVDGLCSLSHVAKGTFYLFYESKEELLFEVLEKEHESLDEEILGKAKEIDPYSLKCDEDVSLVLSFFEAQDRNPLLSAITEEDVIQIEF